MALTQLSGGLSEKMVNLREEILEILAFIEASIDFPEDDVETLDRETLDSRINMALINTEDLLAGSKTAKY